MHAAKLRGQKPPDFISYKPELYVGLEFFFQSWMRLAKGREAGTPTPWPTINEFAKRYAILGENFQRFEFFMSALDEAYLQFMKGAANDPSKIQPENGQKG